MNYELIIIGSGPAGLTAAIYSARAGLNPVVVAGLEFGGQLMTTTLVENYPGFIDGVQGPDLMQNMLKQAEKFGAKVIFQNVKNVNFANAEKKVVLDDEKELSAKAIIIATGAKSRKLGLESEQKYWGKGISSCAICDGAFYKDKVIAVVGGGDSAIEETLFLSGFASKVYLIHHRSALRASKIMQERVFANPKITMLWDSEIIEILGKNEIVTGLKINNTKTEEQSFINISGLFLAIGHIPNTKIFKKVLELDEQGYVIVNDNTKTSV